MDCLEQHGPLGDFLVGGVAFLASGAILFGIAHASVSFDVWWVSALGFSNLIVLGAIFTLTPRAEYAIVGSLTGTLYFGYVISMLFAGEQVTPWSATPVLQAVGLLAPGLLWYALVMVSTAAGMILASSCRKIVKSWPRP